MQVQVEKTRMQQAESISQEERDILDVTEREKE